MIKALERDRSHMIKVFETLLGKKGVSGLMTIGLIIN